MNFKNLLILFFLALISVGVNAQDQHFTLYNMSPVSLNPAQTGAFNGTARVGGIFRDQGFNRFASNKFITPSFYIDAPIFMVRKRDWIGVGLWFLSDKAGSVDLGTTGGALSGSYHLSLNKKSTQMLTLGVQYGKFSRSVDIENSDFGEIVGEKLLENPDQSNKAGYTDINVGLLYKSQINKKSDIELGVVAGHVNSAYKNYSATGSGQDKNKRLARLWKLHGTYNTPLNEKWGLSPSLFIQSEAGAYEVVTQMVANTKIGKEKQYKLNLGLGYRFLDAAEVLVGIETKDLKVWVGYDITLSGFKAANQTVGAVEIGAQYLIKIYKQPEVTPVIICPEY